MFQLSQYPVEQISQNFQKKFNGFKERSIPLEIPQIRDFPHEVLQTEEKCAFD